MEAIVLIRRYFATSEISDILLCAEDNKVQVNPGYANIFFTIYGPLKMLDFSNSKITFGKNLMKNQPSFMTDFQSSNEVLLLDRI